MPSFTLTVVERYEPCVICDDAGVIDCPQCDGCGMDDDGNMCSSCLGEGVVDCTNCED